jgi:hypothetical protein
VYILEPNMHKITPGSSKNAQNPMRNFQKGTKSQEKLPNMHKIRRGSSKNAQDLMISEDHRGILYII